MKFSATLVLASIAIGVQAQGAPSGLAPPGGSPAGCIATGTGKYAVNNVKSASRKRSLEKRVADCSNSKSLIVTLNNGVLLDSAGRIGEIVANRQFQFDGPPAQTGTIYDAGWSICANGSLAIGPTTVFYQCLSGSFYNLYDQPVGAGCIEIQQVLVPCAGDSGSSSATTTPGTTTPVVVASSSSSSSTTSMTTPMMTTSSAASSSSVAVSQATDGQPQATSASNMTSTSAKPTASAIPTGGAASFAASGALVVVGAAAAYFL